MTYVNARISKIVVPLYGSESAMEAADGIGRHTNQPAKRNDRLFDKKKIASVIYESNKQPSEQYHYNVNRQSEMKESGEVPAGRANSTSVIHYSMHMIDMMTKATIDGW
jgi:hypothetical protein